MPKSFEQNTRQMLIELGVPSHLATLAQPYMFYLPGTSDPDAQGVIEIILGIQRSLRKLGYRVEVSGVLTPETAAALNTISPPAGSWMTKSWVQIVGDILEVRRNPVEKSLQLDALGYYGSGYVGIGTTATDQGISLSWGLGTKSTSNCVPTNSATKSAFRNVQRQTNRLLPYVNGGRISEDGIIGSETTRAIAKVSKLFFFAPWIALLKNCTQVAQKAPSVAATFKTEANRRGASASANKGPTVSKTSQTETPGPPLTKEQATQIASIGGGIGETLKKYAPWGALAVGVFFVAANMGGRKRRR